MFDPVSIAMMVASAALSAHSQNQAAKKQQQQMVAAQQRQMMARNQATEAAARKAAEFEPEQRKQSQDQIQQQLTGELEQQVQGPQITAQGVQVGKTIEGGGADYLTMKAREQARVQQSMRGLASLMGRIGSASELRRGEAVGIGDTAGEIGRIQSGAANNWGIDQVGIEAAGRPNAGLQFASAVLGGAGKARAAGSGLGPAAIPGTNDLGAAGRADPMGAWLRLGRGND
jgi:hypothetical protein